MERLRRAGVNLFVGCVLSDGRHDPLVRHIARKSSSSAVFANAKVHSKLNAVAPAGLPCSLVEIEPNTRRSLTSSLSPGFRDPVARDQRPPQSVAPSEIVRLVCLGLVEVLGHIVKNWARHSCDSRCLTTPEGGRLATTGRSRPR